MHNSQYRPIMPWIGGKRRLFKHLAPLIPEHTCYVEPFCGGAAVFFLKPISKAEILNDVNGDVVNLYRVVKHHLDEFVRQFRHALVSRQIYEWLQETPPETLTDIQRAARFFYLQKLSFGAKVKSQTFGTSTTSPPRINLTRIEEDLSRAHIRLTMATIEHLDWHVCVQKYDRPATLFFFDPPYWKTEGYGVPFGLEQYHRLAETMRTTKGKVLLTINDHPDMRAVFRGFKTQKVGITYTVGGACRSREERGELIVMNW